MHAPTSNFPSHPCMLLPAFLLLASHLGLPLPLPAPHSVLRPCCVRSRACQPRHASASCCWPSLRGSRSCRPRWWVPAWMAEGGAVPGGGLPAYLPAGWGENLKADEGATYLPAGWGGPCRLMRGAFLPTRPPACLPTCLPACTCLPAYLPTCLPAYLPAAYLPACWLDPYLA